MSRRFWGLAIGCGLLALLGSAVSGQARRSPATLDDLLSELKGLRADLSQSSAASVRVQLLTARLTLQEQRVNTISRQLQEARTRLEDAGRQRAASEDRTRRL